MSRHLSGRVIVLRVCVCAGEMKGDHARGSGKLEGGDDVCVCVWDGGGHERTGAAR